MPDQDPAGLHIREATEADAPVILDMIRKLAAYEKLSHLVTATEARIRETMFGSKPAAEAILAYTGSECAGFALFFPNYSTFLSQPGMYLEDLFVEPHFRGKGIGFALLRRLASIALERGYGRMEWHVLDWNEPSIQFYKRLGAQPLNDWIKYRLTGAALEQLASSRTDR